MKTVQEWLKEVDEEKLVSTYFSQPSNAINIAILEGRETPEVILAFIRRLKSLTPETPRKQRVFFASVSYRDGIELILCDWDDLLTKRCPERGDCVFAEFAQVMEYWVADTELTQKHIYDILAGVLEQLSFFGYTQEEQTAGRKRVDAMLRATEAELQTKTPEEICKEARPKPMEEFLAELNLELGIKPDPEAQRLKDKIGSAVVKYEMYCFEREVAAVRELLRSM